MSLPAEWLHLPCPRADRAVHRSACLRLEAIRERLAGEFLDAEVERLLDAGDDAGAPLGEPINLARACRRWFGLSPRAFRRITTPD